MSEYIEKQAALKAVCDACGIVPDREKENCKYKFVGCKEYYNVFVLPPADVRPVVRGRWIKLYDNPLDGSFYCSNCKKEIEIADGYITPLDLGMYYCHNCGADMREDKP